jgi:hypothetical protein
MFATDEQVMASEPRPPCRRIPPEKFLSIASNVDDMLDARDKQLLYFFKRTARQLIELNLMTVEDLT